MSETKITDTPDTGLAQRAGLAKQIAAEGTRQMLQLARALGVPEGMVLATCVAAGIGTLVVAGAPETAIDELVAEGKRVASMRGLAVAEPATPDRTNRSGRTIRPGLFLENAERTTE